MDLQAYRRERLLASGLLREPAAAEATAPRAKPQIGVLRTGGVLPRGIATMQPLHYRKPQNEPRQS